MAHAHSHAHGNFGNPKDLALYLDKLEGKDRADWQKPDAVLKALKLKKDDVVADIGAGPGYFALRVAKKVEHVWAVEAEPHIFKVLGERAAKVKNLAPVLGLAGDSRLGPACADLVLIIDTYHHLEGGPRYLQKLARVLRPGGRIVNIDFHAVDLPVGPKHNKIPREDFLRDAQRAGLKLIGEHTFLPYQYFLELGA